MSRKRLTACGLALALAMTARIAVAAPQTSIALLRAATCCAERCPMKPPRPVLPNRCCLVGSPASDPAQTSALRAPEAPPATTTVATLTPVAAMARVPSVTTSIVASVRAGPPPYLRSLRLRL